MAQIDRYTGPWTARQAAHLMRRACFGATPKELATAIDRGLEATIAQLFADRPLPTPPEDPETGLQWVDGGTGYNTQKPAVYYNAVTRGWWTGLMIEDAPSIREKLTLFWSNHFSTEAEIVSSALHTYSLLNQLRTYALGNFKDLTRIVTIEPAMLRYLNGNTNTVGTPNENYARELQELFTIGKGPVAGNGDYTTYTEDDVRAAARVLTGWRENRRSGTVTFVAAQHDSTDKQFSARYNNRVIKGSRDAGAGVRELDELLTMIFDQARTAEHIVERLYRWFVDSIIDDTVRTEVIEPLADQLRSDNYVVGPTLERLLSSQWFFSDNIIGAQLGSPADFVIGLMRSTTTWTAPSDRQLRQRFYLGLYAQMSSLQMTLLEAPTVAGWEAYYQEPGYDHYWITTATLPLRNGLTDAILRPNRVNDRGQAILDSVAFVETLPQPSDSLQMITDLNAHFFAVPFSEAVTMRLAEEVLMDGGRYYEWTQVWDDYVADPSTANRARVKANLDRLFTYLFRMAEFQLV